MVEWFAVLQIGVASFAALVCFVQAACKKIPGDLAMALVLLSALGLLVQLVIAIAAPFVGNPASGDLLEFWLYLIVALALPLGAGFWALIDRSPWALLILAVVELALVVMVYRMAVIWGVWA